MEEAAAPQARQVWGVVLGFLPVKNSLPLALPSEFVSTQFPALNLLLLKDTGCGSCLIPDTLIHPSNGTTCLNVSGIKQNLVHTRTESSIDQKPISVPVYLKHVSKELSLKEKKKKKRGTSFSHCFP